jgi:two-component system, NtrC family, sensor histidine kinase AtoS
MTNVPLISRPALWRGKTPGIIEFGAMMNVLPEAAFLFDQSKGLILQVNSALIKLTAFTQSELCGRSMGDFLPGLSAEYLTQEEDFTLPVKRRNRDDLLVITHVNSLDVNGQWFLISLVPETRYRRENFLDQEKITRDILALARLVDEPDLPKALEKAVEISSSLLGTGFSSVYQAESSYPGLIKLAANGSHQLLPDEISPTDLIRLSTPFVWVPGKRVNTDLHRAGRMANLSYLASTPLGNEGSTFGLLVAGDSEREPGSYILNYLNVIGAHISSTIQHFILVSNLNRENEKLEHLVAIDNCVVENTQGGLLVLNPDLTIAQVNPAAEAILGYGGWEVNGQPVENVLIGSARLLNSLEAACSSIATRNMEGVSLHRRDGQAFPARIDILPVLREDQLLAVVVFIIDNSETEQIRTHTQQLENRAELGEITAMFAHEIRNPINNISTGLQLLSSRLGEADSNQEVINRIQSDCTRLEHLMESVLAFSRPMEHRFEPLEIGLLLTRLMDRYRPRLSRLGITPYIQAVENCPKVVGDIRALERVFINLINNAIDAMNKSGGTLAVRVGLSNSVVNHPQVEVAISDSGPGIPDEIRDKLFEPFVTSKSKGTGLGLAITKRIVTAHQGSISVTTFPGGTVFHVFLPAAKEEGD